MTRRMKALRGKPEAMVTREVLQFQSAPDPRAGRKASIARRSPPHKPLKAGLTEKQVSEQVVQAAALFGVELRRRNVGGCFNASGQYVAFGSPGDSDYYAALPGGRYCEIEVKRGDFDPRRARGASKERFRRQLARLKRTCANGGIGLWVSDASQLLDALPAILAGARIIYDDDGFPYLDR